MEKITNILSWFINRVDCIESYTKEENKTAEIKDALMEAKQALQTSIDFNTLTMDDCKTLRFSKWCSIEAIEANDIVELDKKLCEGKITQEQYEEEKERAYIQAKIMLIPFYLHSIIPDNLTVYDIGGVKHDFKDVKKDKDIRYGYLAYGVIPKE